MTSTRYDESKKRWFGPESKSQVDKDTILGELILKKLSEGNAERVIQIDGDTGETLTADVARVQTLRCAQNLQKLGCTQNDRIVIIARNHHHLTPLTLGAICIGTPIAPLDVSHAKHELPKFLRRLEPSFIFSDTDILSIVDDAVKEIGIGSKIYSINGSIAGFESFETLFLEPTGYEDSFECPKINDSFKHTAVISCSSGSTGMSKSVILPHALFISLFLAEYSFFNFVSLNFSSLYWMSGMVTVLSTVYSSKPRIFTAKPFSPEVFYKLVTDYQIELFVGPPSQFQSLLKSKLCDISKLKSLKLFIPAGSILPTSTIYSLREALPTVLLMTAYGMTELGSGISMAMPNELLGKPTTVGRLLSGVEIKIVDVNTGKNSGPNEEGEIRVIAPIPFSGYYRDEESTRDTMDEDGFFKTGDIGYVDSDGFLYIVGRNKDIFKNCGFFVRPNEIEDILNADPNIKATCVVGVFDIENVTELPAAVVVKQNSVTITEVEVCALISERLAEYKHLSGGVYFVESLPMTASGKVMRFKVKEIAQQFFDQRNNNSQLKSPHLKRRGICCF